MARLLQTYLLLQAAFSSLPMFTHAHMEMSWPYPIRSQLNPAVAVADKDYSYTSPLLADGSNFPCKGYQNGDDSNVTRAVYTAGSTYNMTIAGIVTHEGGSCQLSLSYDNGATFKVIQSMIGGCPLVPGYNFTIPSFAPASGTVLLAWSWFNLVGNREMYMDCARVEIQVPTPGRHRRAARKRQASMNQLPDMFACNVNNGCTTIAGQNVNFPYPGSNVIYGQDSITPDNGTGFTGSGFAGDIAPNGTFNGTAPTPSDAPFMNGTASAGNGTCSLAFPTCTSSLSTSSAFISLATLTSTDSETVTLITGTVSFFNTTTFTPTSSSTISTFHKRSITSPVTTSTGMAVVHISAGSSSSTSTYHFGAQNPSASISSMATTSSSTLVTSTITQQAPLPLPSTCTQGLFFCDTPSTFSTCISNSPTKFTYRGSVAAGMICVNSDSGVGQIIRQNDGLCTPTGEIFCNGNNAFYLCDQGSLINMGPIAPGTKCTSGVISIKTI